MKRIMSMTLAVATALVSTAGTAGQHDVFTESATASGEQDAQALKDGEDSFAVDGLYTMLGKTWGLTGAVTSGADGLGGVFSILDTANGDLDFDVTLVPSGGAWVLSMDSQDSTLGYHGSALCKAVSNTRMKCLGQMEGVYSQPVTMGIIIDITDAG
jgi:hypothetical protein